MYKEFFVQLNVHPKDTFLKVVSQSTCFDLDPVFLKFIFYPQTYFIKSIYLAGLPVSNHRRLAVSFYDENDRRISIPQSAITFSGGYATVNLSKIYTVNQIIPKDMHDFILRHNFTNQCGVKGESFIYWNREILVKKLNLVHEMKEPESYLGDKTPCYADKTRYYKTHFPYSLLYQYDCHKNLARSVYGDGILGISGKYLDGKSFPSALKLDFSKINPHQGTISFWIQLDSFMKSPLPLPEHSFLSLQPFPEDKEYIQMGVFSSDKSSQNWFLRYYSHDDNVYQYQDLAHTQWDTKQWVLVTYTWDVSKNQYIFYLNDKCFRVHSRGPEFSGLNTFKDGLFTLGYGNSKNKSEIVQYDGIFWSNKVCDLSFIEAYYLQCLQLKRYGKDSIARILSPSEKEFQIEDLSHN